MDHQLRTSLLHQAIMSSEQSCGQKTETFR